MAAEGRFRARELGIEPGVFPPGPWNAITDVADVQVGHVTRVEGDDVRTGVTVVRPHPGNLFREKVPAAIAVGNGFGKLLGLSQVEELGELETPVVLTNTLSIFTAADALLDFMLSLPGNEDVRSINPVVAECNDGWLNDIRKRAIRKEHVRAALEGTRSGPVEEGAVGA
ncbi:MAG: P1 family peptidase, partial [Acidobacteria bacterium]|nr:P1 family peptidase [Acidobacteriota bacterium]